MLKLKHLTTHNFGPFKGVQSIEFPDSGIVILYGENMRGKTSFLNAIRYALFGKVVARSTEKQSLHTLSNWEAADLGEYGFKVTLSFTSEEHEYLLTRSHSPRRGVEKPQDDMDYVEDCFLQKNGEVLGPEQRDLELGHIMPEQVSRFFLFDGELLQEYEELLRDDSSMGERITQAIERILGVPILTNSRIDLRDLHKKAQRQESLAAQADQKTRELGTHLDQLMQLRSHHEKEVLRLESERSELKQNKIRLEDELRRTERIKAWLDELDKLTAEVESINTQIIEKRESLQRYMADAWRGMMGVNVKAVQKDLEMERARLQEHVVRTAMIMRSEKAVETGECPTCFRPLDERTKDKIVEHTSDLRAHSQATDANASETLDRLIYNIQVLQSFKIVDRSDIVDELVANIERLIVDRATKEDRTREITQEAEGFDQSKVRAQYANYDKLSKEIALIEDGISNEKKQLSETSENISKLEEKLDVARGNDSSIERQRSEQYKLLHDLFDESVSVYRDELREKVERDATQIFLKLTSEPEYKGLQITRNYGLVILHQDGDPIPVRSAGAEHIVALSLMGALQKNAPLQGPIIMDSPFGRLDETHTSKVIQALPSMADQVLLLVYRSELNPQSARNTLKGQLKAEYKMVRQSAKHTMIEKELGKSI